MGRETRLKNLWETKKQDTKHNFYLLSFLRLQAQNGRHLCDANVLINAADGDQIVLHHSLVQNAVPIARHLK